jgi:hypothetical protein
MFLFALLFFFVVLLYFCTISYQLLFARLLSWSQSTLPQMLPGLLLVVATLAIFVTWLAVQLFCQAKSDVEQITCCKACRDPSHTKVATAFRFCYVLLALLIMFFFSLVTLCHVSVFLPSRSIFSCFGIAAVVALNFDAYSLFDSVQEALVRIKSIVQSMFSFGDRLISLFHSLLFHFFYIACSAFLNGMKSMKCFILSLEKSFSASTMLTTIICSSLLLPSPILFMLP